MTHETAADRLAKVESLLKDAWASARTYKYERDNPNGPITRSTFDMLTGKIRGINEVVDAFAEAGFEVRGD